MMLIHKKVLILFLCCCMSKWLMAQDFQVKATLDTVSVSGFYRIPVRPDITAYTKVDLSDLRIWDNNNQQVPFITRESVQFDAGTQGFIVNPPVTFIQHDSSNNFSYVWIKQPAAYFLDRIVLIVQGPKYYKRTAALYSLTSKGFKRKLAGFEITSGTLPVTSINTLKAKSLLIEIENNDNPPLTVQSVKTEQKSKEIVAFFEKGRPYFIMAGNEKMVQPLYDLSQFRDSLPVQLNSVFYNHLQPLKPMAQRNNKFTTGHWLWLAIIITILALGFLTYKLLKDMKRSGL